MYPYFYPSYFNSGKAGVPAGTGAFPGTFDEMMPKVPTGNITAAPTPMMGPAVPGTTSGSPVTSTPPPPPTVQPPPVDFDQEQGPPVLTDIGYTQAYLKTQIGKKVRVVFLIGTNMTTDRVGMLVGVGISYILIKPEGTDDVELCDMYSIKFVTFFR